MAIPDLGIDLAVVSGDLVVEGNDPDYPLCDVAQYLTTYRYPGRDGTSTWIYAHAREGMFLPLLEASTRADGAELIGTRVSIWTDGDERLDYRITQVLPHATDRTSASGVAPTERRLILQTSEGPTGTVPKLQIVARYEATASATADESRPTPSPRACPPA